MERRLPAIISSYSIEEVLKSTYLHVIEFQNPRVKEPVHRYESANWVTLPITASECRIERCTYRCRILCDLRYTLYDISTGSRVFLDSSVLPHFLLCEIPCVVGSRFVDIENKIMGESMENISCLVRIGFRITER